MSNYSKENLITVPKTQVNPGDLAVSINGDVFICCKPMLFYKCASVDTANKTWTGYKAVSTDGIYSFEETVTEGLTYGTAFTPSVDKIYNADVTVAVSGLYRGVDPSLVFYAPLSAQADSAETGQTFTASGTVTYQTVDGVPCAYFDGSSYLETTSSGLPVGGSPRTVSVWIKPTRMSSAWQGCFGYGQSSSYMRLYVCLNYSSLAINMYGADINPGIEVSESWQHVLITTDANTYRIYVNGTLRDDGEQTMNIEGGVCTIGRLNDGSNYGGYLASCRIYDRVLSDSEITALANEFTPTT